MKKQEQKTTNPPMKTFRDRNLAVKLWQNTAEAEDKTTTYIAVSIERIYRDRAGNFQVSKTLKIDDLPRLALLIESAYKDSCITATANNAGGDSK
ncbi:MAG: hypothetical protein ABII22_04630 [Candidatus Micrarchaeota archaeon]